MDLRTVPSRLFGLHALDSSGLSGVAVLATLGLDLSGLSSGTAFLSKELGTAQADSVGIQADLNAEVLEGVLLKAGSLLGTCLGGADLGLHFVGVDETSEVGVGHDASGQGIAALLGRFAVDGAVNVTELFEGALGPDNEATHVTTGGKLEEVEALDVGEFNTREVAAGFDDSVVLRVHNQGSAAGDVATVTKFALAATEFAGSLSFFDVVEGTKTLEGFDGVLGLLDGFKRVADNAGNFSDVADLVATSHDQRRQGSSSKSRSNGVALLVGVDLAVPLAPGLGGGEHATFTAHVTESSLTGAGSTTARDTGDTGHGTAGTPRVGGVTHTSHVLDGIGLAAVLRHLCVDKVDDVGADRSQQDGGHDNLFVSSRDRNERTRSSHFGRCSEYEN